MLEAAGAAYSKMNDRSYRIFSLIFGLLVASGLLVWILWTGRKAADRAAPVRSPVPEERARVDPAGPAIDGVTQARAMAVAKLKESLARRLRQKDARTDEAVLTFKDEEAYRKFLARAARAGLKVRGQIDGLRTVRVGYETLDPLIDDMVANPADYSDTGANFLVHLPQTPAAEDRPKVSQVPIGNNSLAFLGATGDRSQWGRGVTIAVLDTGVAPDLTLSGGRVHALDIGLGLAPGSGPEDGHGTAVAGLVAGAASDAPGVAAAATILSIRVTDQDGLSDSFTVAQAILAAVDAGARIVNLSLGTYSDSTVLTNAITYAIASGAVIVASAGNDGAAQLTWPAADPRVISVGAVDALEQQVYFSNAGPQLKITAPGYGVDAAWLNGQRVSFDGTSASAPLVAGAIAAIMTTSPGLDASQAWAVLQQYTSDGGVPGPDAEYGAGILNVGWAMARLDPARVDPALAGEYFDVATNTMNVVVQNRGGRSVSGLSLMVSVGGVATTVAVPTLSPGATQLVAVPVGADQLAADGGIIFRTTLETPAGMVDQVPANNRKSGVVVPTGKQ